MIKAHIERALDGALQRRRKLRMGARGPPARRLLDRVGELLGLVGAEVRVRSAVLLRRRAGDVADRGDRGAVCGAVLHRCC
jgi:hypothetical protein